jgi:aminoglycoside phosphotransferase (APT) family kinase protein
VPIRMHDDEVEVDEALVHRLVATQMPEFADQPLARVEPWGTDNAIWRLGDQLVVRLPRIGWAAGQVEREATWLPRLAPQLPVAVPQPVRDGRLCGIVDWGSACAGDPAVDVQVVWSPLFTAGSRRVFLDALEVDDATLARSRGAAIHQACAALPYYLHTYPLIVERSWHKLARLGVRPLTAA